MLTIKLFNSKTLAESKELELAPEKMINGECFIGRSPNCGLVLSSPEVSRVHGSISCNEGQYYFSDLASLSGSRLNDEAVKVNQKYLLKPNDIIRIGGFVLTIQGVTAAELTDGSRYIDKGSVPPPKSTPSQPSHPQLDAKSVKSATPVKPPREYMPIAFIPPEQLNRWHKGDLTVRCVSIIDETPEVKTFRFAATPPVLFTYQPGQFVAINLNLNGKSIQSIYSISSTPSRPHTLDITVKRTSSPQDSGEASPSWVSNWLHEQMTVGREIKLSSPMGQFTCFAHPAQKVLMISAGSGIAPLMSMARWMLDTAADCDIVFFHSARRPQDIIFRQELESLAAHLPKFRLAITITNLPPGQAWCGFTGRLNELMLQAIAPDVRERTVYVSGPNEFMVGVKDLLQQMGLPLENYHEERFDLPKSGKSHPSNPSPTTPPSQKESAVVFAKSKKEIRCDGQETILTVADQQGIKIDSLCRSGICGTCKQKKLKGEVKYQGEPEALDNREREEGYILTCIAYPVGRVVINA